MDRYSVLISHRVPALSGAPTFTQLGPVVASGLSWGEELTREGFHTTSTTPDTLDDAIITRFKEQLDSDDDVSGLELWIHREA